MSKNLTLKTLYSKGTGTYEVTFLMGIVKMHVLMGRRVKIPKYVLEAKTEVALVKALKKFTQVMYSADFYKSFIKQMLFDNNGGKNFRSKSSWLLFPIKMKWDTEKHEPVVLYDTVTTHQWCMQNILVLKGNPSLAVKLKEN